MENPTENRSKYTARLRDLYLQDKLVDLESEIVNVDTLENEVEWLNGIPCSYFPSKSFTLPRWTSIDFDDHRFHRTRVSEEEEKTLIFMRPYDLTFYNFENIIDLNGMTTLTDGLMDHCHTHVLVKKPDYATLVLDKRLCENLHQLANLNLFIKPFNSDERGGKRMIFQSKSLANYLTSQFKKLKLYADENFEEVNNVFRLNKFSASDKFFKRHYDTPYVDQRRRRYSKKTFVFYVKVDPNKPCLKFKGGMLLKFENSRGVIFDHSVEHEGYTFASSEKIFLRTELIFKDENYKIDDSTFDLFGKACYAALKSVSKPALKAYSSELFYNCNMSRYTEQPFALKRDTFFYVRDKHDLKFVTNGIVSIFRYCKNIDLKDLVKTILRDGFTQSTYVTPIDDLTEIDFTDPVCREESLKKIRVWLSIEECECKVRDAVIAQEFTEEEEKENGNKCRITTRYQWCDPIGYGLMERWNENHPCNLYCCSWHNKNDDKRFMPDLVQAIDDNIVDSQFYLGDMQVMGNRIYFTSLENFHFAALYCEWTSDRESFIRNKKRKYKTVHNVFMDYNVDSTHNVIIFDFNFFKNNVVFREEKFCAADLTDGSAGEEKSETDAKKNKKKAKMKGKKWKYDHKIPAELRKKKPPKST